MLRRNVGWAGGVLAGLLLFQTLAKAGSPEGIEFFEKKIRPLLSEHCQKCHGVEKQKGGLRLDSKAALAKGGDTGPVVVAGQPDKSLLIRAVRWQDDLRMPPRSKLPESLIADLTAWVRMGAPWPEEKVTAAADAEFPLEERKKFWCWQPIRVPQVPASPPSDWPISPIDRFILAKLAEKNLSPAPSADRLTLLRRVYFDLIGLPPTLEEIEAFLNDSSPNPLAKVVDQLLERPQFGERWARHWLDLVRFAETRGHEFDYPIPNPHHYRDYVIRALNADVPYDQFVREHIAGDLLPKPRLNPHDGCNESILGTGFFFLGEEVHSPVDIRQDQADRFDNRIDVLTKTFLGLTVSCARCHDHKFDAISTRDYYSLFGFLESSGYRLARIDTLEHHRQVATALAQWRAQRQGEFGRTIAAVYRPAVSRLAEYLLAARAVLHSPMSAAEVAKQRNLDPLRLGRWLAELQTAQRDERHPLHPLAIKEEGAKLVERWKQRRAAAQQAWPTLSVIADYSDPKTPWMTDEFSYGLGPVPVGSLKWSSTGETPIVGIHTRAAAVFDPAWHVLKAKPGEQIETGGLGAFDRSGKTLRTPSFTLQPGRVYYLVRGSGMAYAAVGHHVVIHGPLHGRLVLRFQSPDRYTWVAHDLSPYVGQTTHIEFTPNPGAELSVAMVVQGPNAPPTPDVPIAGFDQFAQLASAEAQVAGLQKRLLQLLDQWSQSGLESEESAAVLADWLMRSPELFLDAPARQQWHETLAVIRGEQQKILRQIRPESRLAPAMWDGTAVDGRVFIRGSHKALGVPTPRRFLEALVGTEPIRSPGSGRLELAQLMTDPKRNPLLARVQVNRVWHHLFGRGLVGSVDNFGVLGEKPTHPELLDYLADQFIRDGWSLKRLIRSLILTRTYQMASRIDPATESLDPDNLLWHRARIRRLEGEAIRDAMLAVSGRLRSTMYGPSVLVHLTSFQEGRGRPASGPIDGDGRRSIYLSVRRNFLSPFLLAFDTPIPFSTVGRRTVSNVPAQALILMNDPLVHQLARLWAERALKISGSAKKRIEWMYRVAYARAPLPEELAQCEAFVTEGMTSRPPIDVWSDLAHVLFTAKEFIYLN